ncbi:GNAT family N-acetyltransferase [Spongiimicrobium salis]|uniref:GNAT family N-acetyltransferase n=1 Tax=Spongiimicrobium salis TaxID=1667022 RepID=UPI00374D9D73
MQLWDKFCVKTNPINPNFDVLLVLVNLQPFLENELVYLRPLREEDFESLYAIAKDPEIWEQHHSKRYLSKEFEIFFKDAMQSEGALVVLDKRGGHIIGSSQFRTVSGFRNIWEIGWTFLARQYWGGIYNKAIKSLMFQYAFQYVDRIVFYIANDNIRSQKAAEKIGAKKNTTNTTTIDVPKKEHYITYIVHK